MRCGVVTATDIGRRLACLSLSKGFEGKIPRTEYRLTELGRGRLAKYWQVMDSIRGAAPWEG
jgi:hypothetical protein